MCPIRLRGVLGSTSADFPRLLIAEDKQLMNDLQKRNLTGNPTRTVRLSQIAQGGSDLRFKVS
jgi:hypothetical protein